MSPFPPVGGLGVHCSLAEMTLLLNELCELDGAVSSFLAGRNGMDKLFVATCGCKAKLDQGERKASLQAASEARRTADEGGHAWEDFPGMDPHPGRARAWWWWWWGAYGAEHCWIPGDHWLVPPSCHMDVPDRFGRGGQGELGGRGVDRVQSRVLRAGKSQRS